ncbi:hypothetical protein T492DRAFT_833328 [Pavlovales sp. CCMP2436]|nr:hypothetical protein T492DRAFT_833328 [Pavlovales sp. CCMP2436]
MYVWEDGVFPLRPAFGYEETNDLSRTFVAESAALAGAARACEGLPRVVAEWCAAAVRALARERFSGRVVELDVATLAVLAVLAERGALAGRAEGAGGAAAAQPPPLLEQVALQLNRWRNAATDAVLLSLAERTWEQREKRVSDLLNSFGRDGELRDAPQLALTVSDLRREDAEMRGALAERGAGGDGAAKPWRGLRLVEGAFQRVLAQRTDAAARLPTRSSAQREVA